MLNSRYVAFQMVAQMQSLTKAADILGYTQSGVSHLIKALEDELGFALFIRSKTGAKLTQEGNRLLPYIEHALLVEKDICNVAEEMRGLKVGSIRLGIFSSVAIHWLPKILSSFKKHHPNITVTVTHGVYSTIETALLENRVDCGFVTLPTRKEFTTEHLGGDKLMAIIDAGSPLSDYPTLTPQQLKEQPFIVPAEGMHFDIGRLFSSARLKPKICFDINDNYAAVAMVRQGIGFTILPELVVQDMLLDDIKAIPIHEYERKIGIAVNKTLYPSLSVKAFIATARKAIPRHNAC